MEKFSIKMVLNDVLKLLIWSCIYTVLVSTCILNGWIFEQVNIGNSEFLTILIWFLVVTFFIILFKLIFGKYIVFKTIVNAQSPSGEAIEIRNNC